MKKIMIFAAFAALLSVASCQKEAVDKSVDSPVFTATIAGDSKSTLNLSDGKIAWELTDEITVKDNSSHTAIYKVKSIDAGTGKATFEFKSGQTLNTTGSYSATYGTAPTTSQTYSATAGKLYMTAPSTSTGTFTFSVQCGLMKINLTKAGESVKSVTVTGIPTGGSETTYTLNCSTAVSIASGANFCVALPAGSYTKIVITNSSDKVCTLDAKNPVVVANNHIKPVTIAENKITFIPEGPLSGVFSVSDTKKVRFSKGNLYFDGTDFKFEDSQYVISTRDMENHHIGAFFWSKNASEAYAEYYGNSFAQNNLDDIFFSNSEIEKAKSDFTVNGVTGKYRCLSCREWKYLFNLKEVEGQYEGQYEDRPIENGIRKDKYKTGLTVCNISACVVLFPDNWDENDLTPTEIMFMNNLKMIPTSLWQKMEGAGAVCLSFGGSYCSYWASDVAYIAPNTEYCANLANAYAISLSNYGDGDIPRFAPDWSYQPHSVRLVTDVN